MVLLERGLRATELPSFCLYMSVCTPVVAAPIVKPKDKTSKQFHRPRHNNRSLHRSRLASAIPISASSPSPIHLAPRPLV
jgi:hypothetical protein